MLVSLCEGQQHGEMLQQGDEKQIETIMSFSILLQKAVFTTQSLQSNT